MFNFLLYCSLENVLGFKCCQMSMYSNFCSLWHGRGEWSGCGTCRKGAGSRALALAGLLDSRPPPCTPGCRRKASLLGFPPTTASWMAVGLGMAAHSLWELSSLDVNLSQVFSQQWKANDAAYSFGSIFTDLRTFI